jgi:16S rRNA (cytosine1402-N4)-methyltransferase
MSQALAHVPVMLEACLSALAVKPNHWFVDGTFGAGGHSRAILSRGGCVLALDRDPWVSTLAADLRRDYPATFIYITGNFSELATYAEQVGLPHVSGVLLDLGVSSMQLGEAERGFAFRQTGPLDMRMSGQGRSAAEVVNTAPVEELAAILYKYGEERYSRRLAKAIDEARRARPIRDTAELAEVISRSYPPGPRRAHSARRTFQALRIYVNDELGALEQGLEAAAKLLIPGGRLVVLSYHSLEDRIVKHAFKTPPLKPLSKKPLRAEGAEVAANPRARSAKLRVAEKLPGEGEA